MVKLLFNSNQKIRTEFQQLNMQDAKSSKGSGKSKRTITKRVKKHVLVKESNESIKEDKNKLSREEQEVARKEELKRIEKLVSHGNGNEKLLEFETEQLPLREAVILSEIIGEPRCKRRYRRRGIR